MFEFFWGISVGAVLGALADFLFAGRSRTAKEPEPEPEPDHVHQWDRWTQEVYTFSYSGKQCEFNTRCCATCGYKETKPL